MKHQGTVAAAAVALFVGLSLGAATVSAQEEADRELIVEKVVIGEASAGFVVQVDCEGFEFQGMVRPPQSWQLSFLADGSPDPDADVETLADWEIVDGAWQNDLGDLTPHACSAVETDDGGANAVSYACEFTLPPLLADDFPADFDACAPTDATQQAAVNMPFLGGEPGTACEAFPPIEGCVDRAVLTVTNSFVEPEPTVPPTTVPATTAPPTTAPAPTTAPTPTPSPVPELPATGASGSSSAGILAALVLTIGGAALVGVARRRVSH